MEPLDRSLTELIASVARALQREGTAQQTLQRVVDLAVAVVPGCEHAGVTIVRGRRGADGMVLETPATSDPVAAAVDRIQYEADQGPCLDAVRELGLFMTGDLTREERWPLFSSRAATETGVRSMLAFRLFDDEDTLGALNLFARTTDAFGVESQAIGAAFATHAAVALVAAREHDESGRLREELHDSRAEVEDYADKVALALALQRSMITRLPTIEGLELSATYRPAAEGHEVGGDFYDAFVVSDGGTCVVIGDVVGHDTSAAATMGALRNVLRGIAYDRVAPPAQILERVDAAVCGLGMEAMATLILARVEQTPEDRAAGVRRLRWSNAGHPPPLLMRADGRTELLEGRPDLLLGADRTWRRHDHVAEIPPGSTVLLYTDGLVERRDEPLTRGVDRLASAMHEATGETEVLSGWLEQVVHRALGDERSSTTDDAAVLAVRVGSAAPAR